MIRIRRAAERGRTELDWLDSRHTFSFGDYLDPAHMGFRSLRVINDDRIRPASGFGMHPHRDMEIVTVVLEGALEHRDSLGSGSVIRPGDVQRMTAGTGIVHSEVNPSTSSPVHLLQIWILPRRAGLPPGYEQRAFEPESYRGRLLSVASGGGEGGALSIQQDADVLLSALDARERATRVLDAGRHAWVQVARGAVELNGSALEEGDGAAVSGEREIALTGIRAADVLVFDLA